MPVAGLVITFADNALLQHDAMSAIQNEPRIEVGVRNGSRLPIVVDSNNAEDDQFLWRWLNQLPGVVFVDVAFVSFESSADTACAVDSPHDQFPLVLNSPTLENSNES